MHDYADIWKTQASGFNLADDFLGIPLITAQTIYWGDVDGGTGGLNITAYTW